MLEVEFKADLSGLKAADIQKEAERQGFLPAAERREEDLYFNGTERDFRKTDEALRLRASRVLPEGPAAVLMTYKGPKLDRESSSREEFEFEISDAAAAGALLSALGFRLAFRTEKTRKEYKRGGVTLCFDEVRGLGQFLELERLTESEELRRPAEKELLEVLDSLHVSRDRLRRKSYLELLEEKQQQ